MNESLFELLPCKTYPGVVDKSYFVHKRQVAGSNPAPDFIGIAQWIERYSLLLLVTPEIFMCHAMLLLLSFRCTVYPERSEGHSCTSTSLFGIN